MGVFWQCAQQPHHRINLGQCYLAVPQVECRTQGGIAAPQKIKGN